MQTATSSDTNTHKNEEDLHFEHSEANEVATGFPKGTTPLCMSWQLWNLIELEPWPWVRMMWWLASKEALGCYNVRPDCSICWCFLVFEAEWIVSDAAQYLLLPVGTRKAKNPLKPIQKSPKSKDQNHPKPLNHQAKFPVTDPQAL